MYFLYKEHKKSGSYYITKKPYPKDFKDREGYCETCYKKMLAVREIEGKAGTRFEGKKRWANYEMPYYDVQVAYVVGKENQTNLNTLVDAAYSDFKKVLPNNGLTFYTANLDDVNAAIKEDGRYYLNYCISC